MNIFLKTGAHGQYLVQYGLLLYFLTPVTTHIEWLLLALYLFSVLYILVGAISIFAAAGKNRAEGKTALVDAKVQAYDFMIGTVGLVIGFVTEEYIVAGIATVVFLSGLFAHRKSRK